tara:strand:- start:4559 stop:5437 length:879 start_codon:yes stop_codon:yes gene_type:complete
MQQLLDMNRDIMFSVHEQNVHGMDGLYAPDKKMLWSGSGDDKRNYISVVNKNYHVVQNIEVLEPLQKQMINYFDPIVLEDVQIKDTILKNGKVCYSEYIFPKIKHGIETDVGHKTEFGLRFVMKNSFDGQGSVVMWSGLIDFFCTNGTVTGKYDVTRKRHTRNFNTDGFINAFEVTMNNHKEIVDGYQRLADKKVKYAQVVNLFDTLTKREIPAQRSGTLSDRLSDQYIIEKCNRGGNAFAVMSAMTHYASHGTGAFNLTRTGDQGTLYKRQEKVTNWLRSDTWKEFVAEAA